MFKEQLLASANALFSSGKAGFAAAGIGVLGISGTINWALAPRYPAEGIRKSYPTAPGEFEAMKPHPGTDFPGGRSVVNKQSLKVAKTFSEFFGIKSSSPFRAKEVIESFSGYNYNELVEGSLSANKGEFYTILKDNTLESVLRRILSRLNKAGETSVSTRGTFFDSNEVYPRHYGVKFYGRPSSHFSMDVWSEGRTSKSNYLSPDGKGFQNALHSSGARYDEGFLDTSRSKATEIFSYDYTGKFITVRKLNLHGSNYPTKDIHASKDDDMSFGFTEKIRRKNSKFVNLPKGIKSSGEQGYGIINTPGGQGSAQIGRHSPMPNNWIYAAGVVAAGVGGRRQIFNKFIDKMISKGAEVSNKTINMYRMGLRSGYHQKEMSPWIAEAVEESYISGGRPAKELEGRWFTPFKDILDWYKNELPENSTSLYSVNVPLFTAYNSWLVNQPSHISKWSRDLESEFLLPKSWANLKSEYIATKGIKQPYPTNPGEFEAMKPHPDKVDRGSKGIKSSGEQGYGIINTPGGQGSAQIGRHSPMPNNWIYAAGVVAAGVGGYIGLSAIYNWNYPVNTEWGRASGYGSFNAKYGGGSQVLRGITEEDREEMSVKSKGIVERGNFLHVKMQDHLVSMGTGVKPEYTVRDMEAKITGHIDLMVPLRINGEKVAIPYEIKTVSAEGLKKLKGIKEEHVAQSQFYIHTLNVPYEGFIYMSRSDPSQYKIFYEQRDEAKYQQYLSNYRYYQDYAKKKGLTPQRASHSTISIIYDQMMQPSMDTMASRGDMDPQAFELVLAQAAAKTGIHRSSDIASDFDSPHKKVWSAASRKVAESFAGKGIKELDAPSIINLSTNTRRHLSQKSRYEHLGPGYSPNRIRTKMNLDNRSRAGVI